jgi:hypothetical protein
MIEVQFVSGSAHHTLPAVALPNLEFNGCGNDSAASWRSWHGCGEVFLTLYRLKPEFEHPPVFIVLLPGVHQMEHAVVGPDARSDFFVDADSLRRPLARFGSLCSSVELAILGGSPAREEFWLVDDFGIRACFPTWVIVAFIDQGVATILNTISIWRVPLKRHQDHGVVTA